MTLGFWEPPRVVSSVKVGYKFPTEIKQAEPTENAVYI